MSTDEGDMDIMPDKLGVSEQEDVDKDGCEYVEEEYFIVATLPEDEISKIHNRWKQNNRNVIPDQGEPADSSIDHKTHIPKYAIIDVDTERPMLEIEGTIYRGVPDELLGTNMLFDIGAANSESMSAELVGTTSRVINFHPVKFHKR
ncbi:hypothetical protein IW140_003509 [Coemansia sp. RSA 1813]|nr:hypothetical protein EV178_003401 [Coemansia sp. RSA 1646]KAJ1772927.1 hypothetical protein LPJ74_001066 [Coemansia sp. RSA 1843]KAJ2093502.1 hypothetical protein IW138_000353 [Coemansia sp. RSA 986]KAJ2214319.1 hypothetical protein EV179_003099 [Coemansia sp. RSA 487]KAJ2568885.1 hypothetical protein IW140_003509 [Coemansia sp. RSA 1813]